MSTKLTKLLLSGLSVFTLDDLGIIWGQKNRSTTRQSARDYAQSGDLVRLHQGVYCLPNSTPDRFLLANKLLAPSYVTGLSVLVKAGLSYQYTDRIFSVASYNKSIQTAEGEFVYSQVKSSILFNPLGILNTNQTSVASSERAVTDLIYLSKGRYSLEKFGELNLDLLIDYAKIYNRSYVEAAVQKIREDYAG